MASPATGPPMTSRARARSRASRASGPRTPITTAGLGSAVPGTWPWRGARVSLGRWPYTPQKAAGTRIDPPMSLPNSMALSPVASAAAPPPVLPPGVRAESQGLRVRPKSGLSVCQSEVCVGTLVLPRSTAPACSTAAASGLSRSARARARAGTPEVVGRPATSMASLMVTGSPWSNPGTAPRARAASARRAASRADSKLGVTMALRAGLYRAIRSRCRAKSSSAPISPAASARSWTWAGRSGRGRSAAPDVPPPMAGEDTGQAAPGRFPGLRDWAGDGPRGYC